MHLNILVSSKTQQHRGLPNFQVALPVTLRLAPLNPVGPDPPVRVMKVKAANLSINILDVRGALTFVSLPCSGGQAYSEQLPYVFEDTIPIQF